MDKKQGALKKNLVLLLTLILVFFLAEKTWTLEESATPQLTFKKSVIIKEYKGGQAYTEHHAMKRGEYLWKILREHYKMSDARIASYCIIARAVNPQIRDLNKLYPDQKIFVPYKYVKKDGKAALKTLDSKGQQIDLQSQSAYQEYVLLPGQHVFKVLREIYQIPDEFIFSDECLELLKKANPTIDDFDTLEIGQKIIIPPEIIARAGFVAQEKMATVMPTRFTTGATNVDTFGEEVIGVSQFSWEPSEEEMMAKDMVSSFVNAFDGTAKRLGSTVIPFQDKAKITLDYANFPLYELPWDKKILFDYGTRLPSKMQKVIQSDWENVEIVAVNERDDMEAILDKVLKASGFYKIEKGGEYIVNHDNIQLSVSGNWIIFQDNLLKNIFVINLIEDSSATVNPVLKSYLADLGLKLVDIDARQESAIEKKTEPESLQKDRSTSYASIHETTPITLTDFILDAIGQKYFKNYNTKIFQNMYDGFTLEVMADRMFEKQNIKFIIDFQKLPQRLLDIVVEQGFRIMQIDPHEKDLPSVVKRVLDFLEAPYSSPAVNFQGQEGQKSHIKITIPGFLIKTDQGDVLLTQVELKEPVQLFLSDLKVKVVLF